MAPWLPGVLSFCTFISTFLGGSIALRTRGSLRYLFAFTAGTLLAIAFTDLLPEAIAASAEAPGFRIASLFHVNRLKNGMPGVDPVRWTVNWLTSYGTGIGFSRSSLQIYARAAEALIGAS